MQIINARVITPDGEKHWLEYHEGVIRAVGEGAPAAAPADDTIDAGGLYLLPGFIDLHMHGAAGHDVMDASADGLREIARFCARHGVTSFLPTTLTDRHERIMAALENIRRGMSEPGDGAHILGAHVEGPYLNAEKCGAQNPQYIRLPSQAEVDALFATGVIRLIAIAPEFDENQLVIAEALRHDCTVSVAHSSASAAQTLAAVARGVTHSTHTFNAQTPLHHREPGIVGAVLATPNITCELIADNIHVHPLALRVVWLCKRPHHVALITDAVRAAGMPEGEYRFDERTVVLRDGAVRLPDGTLAGSALTMDRALHNFMQAADEPLEAVWPASSLNAARAVGVAQRKGSLEVGKDADLVLVDQAINVYMTIVGGRVAYRRDPT